MLYLRDAKPESMEGNSVEFSIALNIFEMNHSYYKLLELVFTGLVCVIIILSQLMFISRD